MVLTTIIASLSLLQASQSALPPALQIDQSAWDRMYAKGFDDADHRRKLESMSDKFKRGIGKIRTAPLREETVSWLWYVDPMIQAYASGWNARHLFMSDEEVRKMKAQAYEAISKGRKHLYFNGVLNILPSFGGPGGRIDHRSTPEELKGVRIVLQIADRIYQPQRQPGDLEQKANIGENDRVDTETSSTYSSWGSATSYYQVLRTQKFDYYQGVFNVVFDLFDADGTPRVKSGDKVITAIVIYGPNERKAVYNIDDFLAIRK